MTSEQIEKIGKIAKYLEDLRPKDYDKNIHRDIAQYLHAADHIRGGLKSGK